MSKITVVIILIKSTNPNQLGNLFGSSLGSEWNGSLEETFWHFFLLKCLIRFRHFSVNQIANFWILSQPVSKISFFAFSGGVLYSVRSQIRVGLTSKCWCQTRKHWPPASLVSTDLSRIFFFSASCPPTWAENKLSKLGDTIAVSKSETSKHWLTVNWVR